MDPLLEQLTGTPMDSLFCIPGVRLVGVVEIVLRWYVIGNTPLKVSETLVFVYM